MRKKKDDPQAVLKGSNAGTVTPNLRHTTKTAKFILWKQDTNI